jgi:hypothetical protein
MTLQTIQSDGTLGGRFTAADGWTTQNGKLPGLFGKPVEMPAHLGGVAIVETDNYPSLQVYPNPTSGELRVDCRDAMHCVCTNIEIFDVFGRKQKITLNSQLLSGERSRTTTLNLESLPTGVYFLQITTENSVVTKKIIKN